MVIGDVGMQIAVVQAAIFTPDSAAFSQNAVLSHYLGEFGEQFSGPITSLPIPETAPAEVPRVLLQSPDGAWRLNASPARLDAIWSTSDALANPDALVDTVAQCAQFLESYVERNAVRVDRTALIISRALQIDNPARLLIERFCNEEVQHAAFRGSANFEIHNHKVYNLPGIDRRINSWVRCKTAQVLQQPGIVVEQDLNTLQEDRQNNRFGPAEVHEFFDCARRESDAILRIYFPREL
jgi:hypothetical protein